MQSAVVGGHQALSGVQVKKLDSIQRDEFESNFRNKRPFILTGLAKDWPAITKWTPEYLQTTIGSAHPEIHKVFLASDNRHFLAKGEVETIPMTLTQVIQHIYEDVALNEQRIYLRAPLYSELIPDIDLPIFLLGAKNEREEAEIQFEDRISGLWIGSKGNITPLHYDLWHGFLIQISGEKSVVLFSPDDASLLYQHSSLSPNAHTSKIDLCLSQTELQTKFPSFSEATPYCATLRPGELLYIPPCWWHDVVSLDNAISVTLRWNLRTYESIHPCALK